MEVSGVPGQRLQTVTPIADDGDEFSFCSTCAFSAACLSEGYGKRQLRDLHHLIQLLPCRIQIFVLHQIQQFICIAGRFAGNIFAVFRRSIMIHIRQLFMRHHHLLKIRGLQADSL